MRSAGFRFLVVGLLALVMFIPLFFVGDIIDERARYSRETIRSISQEWGGAQSVQSLVLWVPVTETVTKSKTIPRLDARSGTFSETVNEEVTEIRQPVLLTPERFSAEIATSSEIRHRGIFEVPVYRADLEFTFDFDFKAANRALTGAEKLDWDRAELRLSLETNRALRRVQKLTLDGSDIPLEPLVQQGRGMGGIRAALGDPRDKGSFRLVLGVNGAQNLRIAPMGRDSRITITSDWPHPSFGGAFLPDEKEVRDDGFTAVWAIPHLAGAVAQVMRATDPAQPHQLIDVAFFQPNDFYQKAYRAGRYGILFIALTFVTVILVEGRTKSPAHPVQYVLIGLAQSMFVLLMVAFAEQIGFARAFGVASAATIGLITAYGASGLKLGRGAAVLGAMLTVLYAVLFLILRSADYALLAGTCLCFAALAATMYGTRNEEWYGNGVSRPKWFRQPQQTVEPK